MGKTSHQLLTVTQAAAKLGVTPVRVRQFCQQGRLGFKPGGFWLITETELRRFARKKRCRGVSLQKNEK